VKELYEALMRVAYRLLQSTDPVDHEAAAWIQKAIKADKARARKPRRRKVRLADHGRAGEFYVEPGMLEETHAQAEEVQELQEHEDPRD